MIQASVAQIRVSKAPLANPPRSSTSWANARRKSVRLLKRSPASPARFNLLALNAAIEAATRVSTGVALRLSAREVRKLANSLGMPSADGCRNKDCNDDAVRIETEVAQIETNGGQVADEMQSVSAATEENNLHSAGEIASASDSLAQLAQDLQGSRQVPVLNCRLLFAGQ